MTPNSDPKQTRAKSPKIGKGAAQISKSTWVGLTIFCSETEGIFTQGSRPLTGCRPVQARDLKHSLVVAGLVPQDCLPVRIQTDITQKARRKFCRSASFRQSRFGFGYK
jgi:hypothetical protein